MDQPPNQRRRPDQPDKKPSPKSEKEKEFEKLFGVKANDESKENVPKRHELLTLEEAPLIQKKILLTKPTPIYPDRVSMLKQQSGVEEKRVPAQYHVIRESGRVNAYLLANSKGEQVGWVRLPESGEQGYEWSTNYVWHAQPGDKLTLFSTEDDANKKRNGIAMPQELSDPDYVFPVLKYDSDKLRYLIGNPFPRTLKSDLNFPMWVTASEQNTTPGDTVLLVDKMELHNQIRDWQFLIDSWSKLLNVPDKRKDTENLLNATQLAIVSLSTGNTDSLQCIDDEKSGIKTADFMRRSGDKGLADFMTKTIDDIAIMDDDEFAVFLRSLRGILSSLTNARNADGQYSVFYNGDVSHRVLIDL